MDYIPVIGLSGRFVFKPPFVAGDDQLTVVALRSFGELQQQGIDPYTAYYVPLGLVNGQTLNGDVFDFQVERNKNPVIIYLQNPSGKIIAVPSTYLDSMPQAATTLYQNKHIVLSVGAYAADDPLTQLIDDLVDRATYRTGEVVSATLVTTPIVPALTQDQIDGLVAAREVHYQAHPTVFEELLTTKAKLEETKTLVNTLSDLLRQHGLLN